MSKKKKLSLDELKVLVFEKGGATNTQKRKLFKLAKANDDMETIEKLRDDYDYKSAKVYFEKLQGVFIGNAARYDESTDADSIKIIITSPYDTAPELQTEEGIYRYLSMLSELSYSELCIELSNVLAARHNLAFYPVHSNMAKKHEEKVTDLNDKSLIICINKLFDGDIPIGYWGKDNISTLIDKIIIIDSELAQEELTSEQHGCKMIDRIRSALLEDEIDFDYESEFGFMALRSSVKKGDIKFVKLLINKGADVDRKLNDGSSVLMLAIKEQYNDIARELIENGINLNAFVYDTGETALIFAILDNNIEIVKLLLEYGANVNQLISGYYTALDICVQLHKNDFIELLSSYGAKRCNLISPEDIKSSQELVLDDDLIVEDLFHKVDSTITSSFVAKQFILEEIEGASSVPEEDNPYAKAFVDSSGFEQNEYEGALDRSLPEVDGANGSQDMLNKWLLPYMNIGNHAHTLKVVKLRYKINDLIMKKYSLGKYSEKIRKINIIRADFSGSIQSICVFADHLTDSDFRRYEKINERKYYSQELKKYIELNLDNKVVYVFYNVYDAHPEKTVFEIFETEEISRQEFNKYSISYKKQNRTHNPRRLSKILHLFTEDNPIKYSSHSFEWSRYGSYDKFMVQLRHEFDEIDEELLQLSPNLHAKIRKFMFDEVLNDKNTWGKHKIKFGWSSSELKGWCQVEERKTDGKQAIQYKLPKEFQQKVNDKTLSSFGDVCDVLKNEIEIRDDEKLITLFEKMEEDILESEFKVNYSDNFNHVSFYTDVEKFQNALKKIFEQFKKKNREQYDEIDVAAKIEDKYIDILIAQIGSYSTQSSSDMREQAKDGDFKDIKDGLFSLCDWSVESRFSDGNYRVHYLKIGQEEVQAESIKEAKGFTYRLRFYK